MITIKFHSTDIKIYLLFFVVFPPQFEQLFVFAEQSFVLVLPQFEQALSALFEQAFISVSFSFEQFEQAFVLCAHAFSFFFLPNIISPFCSLCYIDSMRKFMDKIHH